jgi:hypothetical protein
MSLKEQFAEYRAGWFKRVPVERQAIMERHIAQLRNGEEACELNPKLKTTPTQVAAE